MWRQIKNTRYEVSDNGEIRNKMTNRMLKQYKNDNGYMTIGLTNDGKKKTYLVHRLVAEAFIETYDKNLDVNHKNGLRYDNNLKNLECVSRQANNDDRVFSHYYFNGLTTIKKVIELHSNGLTPEEIFITLRNVAKENQMKD